MALLWSLRLTSSLLPLLLLRVVIWPIGIVCAFSFVVHQHPRHRHRHCYQHRQQQSSISTTTTLFSVDDSSSSISKEQIEEQQPKHNEEEEIDPDIVIVSFDEEDDDDDDAVLLPEDTESSPSPHPSSPSSSSSQQQQQQQQDRDNNNNSNDKLIDLMFCGPDSCRETNRERINDQNRIVLTGPATGQVAYEWSSSMSESEPSSTNSDDNRYHHHSPRRRKTPTVLFLVRKGSPELLQVAADAIQQLTQSSPSTTNLQQQQNNIKILLDPSTAARISHYHGVRTAQVDLWEQPESTPGFGSDLSGVPTESSTTTALPPPAAGASDVGKSSSSSIHRDIAEDHIWLSEKDHDKPLQEQRIDLICTIGGDGLLLHTAMLFPGPMPPVLSVSGGSLGFLTPFTTDEMVDAIRIALDMTNHDDDDEAASSSSSNSDLSVPVFPPNMPAYPYEPLSKSSSSLAKDGDADDDDDASFMAPRTLFNSGPRICISIRMRLDCRIVNRHGAVRARYNVLNEVVIDRGSSSYLSSLECFCDDVHLTTVQADGIIFATPTGSTAYSMAAGGSVVHPSVPAILVTPICPHVLSFRSMIFPDHVVLRCLVPEDARARTASVALDGAQRRHELHRGDYVLVTASNYPVPTINRADHSADWLGSLKENFHFNTRRRQRPL